MLIKRIRRNESCGRNGKCIRPDPYLGLSFDAIQRIRCLRRWRTYLLWDAEVAARVTPIRFKPWGLFFRSGADSCSDCSTISRIHLFVLENPLL